MKNEDEMVAAVLRGDQNCFELLLRPYRRGLLNMAYRMTGNSEEAKEVCQEAFIRVFRYLNRFKKGKSFKNWIYKIVVNTSYDFLRGKGRYAEIVESQKRWIVRSAPDPEKRLLNKEIKDKIETCLQRLSPKEKAVFLLRDEEGFSVDETSKILKCSSLSVRTHLSRARQKIREQFEKIYSLDEREVKL